MDDRCVYFWWCDVKLVYSSVPSHTYTKTIPVCCGWRCGGGVKKGVLSASSCVYISSFVFLCWSPEWHVALSCTLSSSWQPNHLPYRSTISLQSVSVTATLLRTLSLLIYHGLLPGFWYFYTDRTLDMIFIQLSGHLCSMTSVSLSNY